MTGLPGFWQRWRQLEQRTSDGEPTSDLVETLSSRRLTILNVLDALERGDRAPLDRLVNQPSELDLDLRAVLQLATSTPGEHDPTEFRARWKSRGITNAPFPALDLLRLTAVAIELRKIHRRAPALAKASEERPVLHGALMGLSPKFAEADVAEDLAARSPRLHLWWRAAVAISHHPESVRDYLDFHRVQDAFPPAAWPDLEDPLRHGDESLLDQWLADPAHSHWSGGLDALVLGRAQTASPAERDLLLSRLLDAIQRGLEGGAASRLEDPVAAARSINALRPEGPARDSLEAALEQMALRLGFWAQILETDSFVALWSAARQEAGSVPPWLALHLLGSWEGPIGERYRLQDAHSSDRGYHVFSPPPTGEFEPERSAATLECFASALHLGEKAYPLVFSLMTQSADRIPARAFVDALSSAPAHLRPQLTMLFSAVRGDIVRCLDAVQAAAKAGNLLWLMQALSILLIQSSNAAASHHKLRKRILTSARQALAALGEAETPPTPAMLNAVVDVVHQIPNLELDVPFLKALALAARETKEAPRAADGKDQADRVRLLWSLQLTEVIAEELTLFGRWLRTKPTATALEAALLIVASLAVDPEIARPCRFGSTNPAPADLKPLTDWITRLTPWIDAQDRALVEDAAEELNLGGAQLRGLWVWFDTISSYAMDRSLIYRLDFLGFVSFP